MSLDEASVINKDGRFKTKIYVVNVHFSTSWREAVVAFETNLEAFDFLIGMDLLTRGNFSLKQNREGFQFSFEKI